MDEQPNNLLHGKTLQFILQYLVDYYGWDGMYNSVQVKCFHNDPSIKSSLKFLRRTEWARKKVEGLYLQLIGDLDIRP